MQKLLNDEDFFMTLVRLQDTDLSYYPLWELYGHDTNSFLTIMNKAKAKSIEYFVWPGYPRHMTEEMKQVLQSWRDSPSLRHQVASNILLTLQHDWHSLEL